MGTTSGTVAAGNDSRITGAFPKAGGTISGPTIFSAQGLAVRVPNGSATIGLVTQAGSTSSFTALTPSTHGSYCTAATGAFLANNPTAEPQVSSFAQPSDVANYIGRDSVALFAPNQDRKPTSTVLNLPASSYSATQLCPPLGHTSQQQKTRIGASMMQIQRRRRGQRHAGPVSLSPGPIVRWILA